MTKLNAIQSTTTDEQTYTPIFVGVGTPVVNRIVWSRAGQRIFVEGRFTTGVNTGVQVTMTLPSGLFPLGVDSQQVGVWFRNAGTASTRKTGAMMMVPGSNNIFFTSGDYTTAAAPFAGQLGTDLFTASEVVNVKFDLPIIGRSGCAPRGRRARRRRDR